MARFYFAFVNSTDKNWSSTFKRNDADVFAFEMTHEEGQFCRLDVELKNPRVGLLSPGRKQWAWLSYEKGQTTTPLFFGRMIGAPMDIDKEIVKLSFVAKPSDFNSQKTSLADSLKVLPTFDPVWISADRAADPESVLESIPKLWHIDRTSHAVSVSDINIGEDGTINIGDDFFYESLSIGYSSPPLMKIDVEGTVTWTEDVSGTFDISNYFPRPLQTLTGGGLINEWPDLGTDIGGNWSIGQATISRQDGKAFPITLEVVVDPSTKDYLGFPVWKLLVTQKISYEASRQRSETVKFSLEADIQEIFSDSGEDSTEFFSVSSDSIDAPIDGSGTPLVTGITNTYFKTDRGKKSLEYLISVAKTKLLSRARAVFISAETSFDNGLAYSCRKNISITDSRVATGTASGKISSYSLYCNGDSGEIGTKFTIGCTIGSGSQLIVDQGLPTYSENYVNGYQYYSGGQTVV